MNPIDFVELAIKLSANPAEAAQRSAISRAHYGCFHSARVLIESCGITFSNSAETHRHLPYCMRRSGDVELATAGQLSETLRTVHNSADYELDDHVVASPKSVQIQLGFARKVLETVLSASQRLPSFRRAVREYAKNVLGKVLHEGD